jgi:hypothetical protein
MPASDYESDAEQIAFKAGMKEATDLAQSREPLTIADVRAMSPEEIAARMPEVRAALRAKPADTSEEGDNDADDK